MPLTVTVTAFKPTGKFYTSSNVPVGSSHLWGALEQVKQKIRDGVVIRQDAVERYHYLVEIESGNSALTHLLLIGQW